MPVRFLFALLLALLCLPPAAHAAVPDGGLVRVIGKPEVYRIVGGAPLWVSVCPPDTNGCAGFVEVPNLNEYGQYPRDGALSSGGRDGGIYRWAGGAPLWISSCGYAPGCPHVIIIDDRSYEQWNHVRRYPADGTVIRNVGDGGYYRFAGGAPLLVECRIGAGCATPTMLDGGTFSQLGSITPGRSNLRQYPADGTTLQHVGGAYFRVAGGSPLPLTSCAGCQAVLVDDWTFQFAGTGTPTQPHLRAAPTDGTFLTTGTSSYRVAGGAALALADCRPLDGCPGAVAVDAGTIAGLGGGRLLATPKDGTVLRGLPSKRTWEIVGGKRRETFIAGVSAIDVDDGAIAALPADTVVSPPPVIIPAPFAPTIFSAYKVRGKRVYFTSLGARNVPAGARVTISCKGRGCPFKSRRFTPRNGRVNALKAVRRARFAARARLILTVTAPDGARKRESFRFRGAKLPVRVRQCKPAGGKFKRC